MGLFPVFPNVITSIQATVRCLVNLRLMAVDVGLAPKRAEVQGKLGGRASLGQIPQLRLRAIQALDGGEHIGLRYSENPRL